MSFENPSSSNPEPEENVPHSLTEKELQAVEGNAGLIASSREYQEGIKKLNFEYTFSTGEVFTASENENGTAHLVITREGTEILNFQDFLPNFTFATPAWYAKQGLPKKILESKGNFSSEPFRINIGEMNDSRSIIALLHEIGHGRNLHNSKDYYREQNIEESWKKVNGSFKQNLQEERQYIAELISVQERNAWATCLKLVREVKEKTGVNLLEDFNSFDELQEFISGALITYREGIGKEMIVSDQSLLKNISEGIKKKLWGEEQHHSEQWEFMKKLFDKDRLKRKSLGELK